MKLIRKHASKIALVLSFSILFVSCSTNADDNIDTPTTQKLSGEEMFKQIFFMTGGNSNLLIDNPTYSVQIEKLNQLSPKQKKDSENFLNEMIGLMKNEDNNFFNDFKYAITLKNPYLINENINKGAFLFQETLKKSSQKDIIEKAKEIYAKKFGNSKIKDEKELKRISDELTNELLINSNFTGKEEACLAVAFVVAAVVWEVAALVNVVAVATVFTCVKGINLCHSDQLTQSDKNTFTQEKLISEIIEKFN